MLSFLRFLLAHDYLAHYDWTHCHIPHPLLNFGMHFDFDYSTILAGTFSVFSACTSGREFVESTRVKHRRKTLYCLTLM